MRIADMSIGDIIFCSKCNNETPLNARMIKAMTRICNSCQSESSVLWAINNRDKKRLSNNKYQKKISSKKYIKTKKYRLENPEKKKAHQAVQSAIRNGSLLKKQCEVCGENKTHGHHDDYSKPLDVIWLCSVHHYERHKMLKARQG